MRQHTCACACLAGHLETTRASRVTPVNLNPAWVRPLVWSVQRGRLPAWLHTGACVPQVGRRRRTAHVQAVPLASTNPQMGRPRARIVISAKNPSISPSHVSVVWAGFQRMAHVWPVRPENIKRARGRECA